MRIVHCILGLAFASVSGIAAAAGFYGREAASLDQPLRLEAIGASSTRSAGALAHDGFEESVRLGWSPAADWTLEGDVGALHGGDGQGRSFAAEVRRDLLDGGAQFGAGYRRDFDGTSVPYLRFGASTTALGWNLAGGALVEKPLSATRDAMDVILNAGASRWLAPDLRAGLELAGEDLEGLFATNEAEGGAKLVIGPVVQLPRAFGRLKIGVAWVHVLSVNTSPAATAAFAGDGLALRAGLSF